MSLTLPASFPRQAPSLRRALAIVGLLTVAGLLGVVVWRAGQDSPGAETLLLLGLAALAAVVLGGLVMVVSAGQHRLVRTLAAVRRVAVRTPDPVQRVPALLQAVAGGLVVSSVRLTLDEVPDRSPEGPAGVWTVGPDPGPDPGPDSGEVPGSAPDGDGRGHRRGSGGRNGLRHRRTPLVRGDRPIGSLELWSSASGLRNRWRGRQNAVLLPAVAGALAAELEISGLADRLAREAADHGRSLLQDPLTLLANRAAFIAEVDRWAPLTPMAVAVLDVNRFAEINATLGHQLGDAVLREVAARVVDTLPEGSLVARIGGDELGMLVAVRGDVDGVSVAVAADEVFAPVVERIRCIVDIDGVSVLVDAAVGVALAPGHGGDAAVLLRRAESAMQQAKERRTTAYQVWEPGDEARGARNLELAGDLRAAIAARQLEVHYQPKTDLTTDAVVGVEGLVRWRHPRHGWIAPDELIPLAERTGLVGELTRLVLATALAAGAQWNRQGLGLGVAVNVSARGLLDRTLVDDVCAALHDTGFDPHLLTLEITETELTPDAPVAFAVLDGLRALGVRISIDDFGTGYSALGYLARLRVDEIKIDKSFVTDLGADPAKRAIVEAVVSVADSLGLATVAEGVEDEAVLDRLAAMGCTTAQGYLLSKPLSDASMSMWLWERRRRLGARPVARPALRPGAA